MKRLHALVLATALASPTAALAWGSSGHRMIGEVAVRALPADVPAFLHAPQAALDVGELSREPDRVKGAGRAADSDLSPGHFLDLGDDGKVLGGPLLSALPATRVEYETQLRAAGQDSWKAGYLPYSIVETYERLAHDFAYWRVLKAAEANPAWAVNRAWFSADRRRREALILADIGALSHFVGDGSQPLHVTLHFNGWGSFPNPAGYSNDKLHSPFESDLVQATVKEGAVAAQVAAFHSCGCPIEQRTWAYLAATGQQVIPFYEMVKAGGLTPGDPRGTQFATRQMAIGATELRDLIVEAWGVSRRESVGYKPVAVADVEAGKVDPYPGLYGTD
ncbi:S1/P1 Nuclease [Phenylobacterium sp.]|uniref:S1/P1 Nuclease n=1 Tax=Phenylobacterium sp. TaxID=1871053 RepID=UPI002DEC9BFA|nr:S1/P1 Nuclease [Phenylobacterium sp.]